MSLLAEFIEYSRLVSLKITTLSPFVTSWTKVTGFTNAPGKEHSSMLTQKRGLQEKGLEVPKLYDIVPILSF